jgi:hypothetical protein
LNRSDLLAALQSARAVVSSLEAALAEVDGALPDRAPEPRLVDSAVASQIIGLSRSWLYKHGKRLGLGFRSPTGVWRFFEDRCRAFRNGLITAREDNDGRAICETADDSAKGLRTP